MSHPAFEPVTPMQVVAKRIQEVRKAKDWTAEQLGEKMAELGYKWDRYTVGNLERGRRRNLTIEELLGLAYVLDVAPVHLLVPVDDSWYLFTPDQAAYAGRVREWVRGNHWMIRDGGDERRYYTDVPADEWQAPRPLTDEERERRDKERREQHAARLAELEALRAAGDPRVEYHPGTGPGTDSYTYRPSRTRKEAQPSEPTGTDTEDPS